MLDHAVIYADIVSIRFLLLFNIDLNLPNKKGDLPLEIAVKINNPYVFYVLIGLHLKTDEFNDVKDTRTEEALKMKCNKDGKNLFHIAWEVGNYEVFEFLYKNEQFDNKEKDNKSNDRLGEDDILNLISDKHNGMWRDYRLSHYVINSIILNDLRRESKEGNFNIFNGFQNFKILKFF
jgi:ankyrin repeat protein